MKKTMTKLLPLAVLASGSSIAAQMPKVDVGVMVDAYYLYNMNEPKNTNGDYAITNRNYDNQHNDFTLNLFEVNFSGKMNNIGFYADLDFGNFADQNQSAATTNGGSNGSERAYDFGQAYLTYETNGYTFSAGKMYTNVGFEVAKAQENWNYSRSFSFSLGGPFWHEGISLTKSYDKFGWGLYIYDSWDTHREVDNSQKTYSAQLNWNSGDWNVVYNFMTGSENTSTAAAGDSAQKSVHELNATYTMSNSTTIAFDIVKGTDADAANIGGSEEDITWLGTTLYVHHKMGKYSFTPRFETFKYENNALTAEDGTTVIAAEDDIAFTGMTFTTAYALEENSEVRFEIRRDSASEKFYVKDDELEKTQDTLSLSWLYKM